MNLEIRRARPDDSLEAVPLIISSGPEAFDYIFGGYNVGDPADFVRFAFEHGEGVLGFRNHFVGVIDGKVIATVAAYTQAEAKSHTLPGARQIIRFFGVLSGISVMLKGLKIESLMVPPKEPLLYVAHFGVAPELRGQGIGTKMLAFLMDEAKALDQVGIALDVADNNPNAQRLYERTGMKVSSSTQKELENPQAKIPLLHRMEMKFVETPVKA
ncbi:GNAT family N-acetyltransferase [Pontibacter sp. G13]|uniref:GNAT family N-acetyltransferase n=1 Tax=Pontibacter sp. G13 TaxID=3074898 RepID=UPI00288A2979|nr:GNAT family N-acetyltransferase [Pontibacter sp. G13]WNJ17319.1 GNAT family N-acetyltransferase [Pontibacter sp. G13]